MTITDQPNYARAPMSDDETSLAQWVDFLQIYSSGSVTEEPGMPALTPELQAQLDAVVPEARPSLHKEDTLYSSTSITPAVADTVRGFYCSRAYLPPPRSPDEADRERCVREYDLYSTTQMKNMQMATDLILAFFPRTIASFSLYQDRVQRYFAVSGPPELMERYGVHTGLSIPAEDSLCGHVVLYKERIFFLPDLSSDWRYVQNPFNVAGYKSFIGALVTLDPDPLNATKADTPERIGIGSLNICFIEDELKEMSPQQIMVVNSVTQMLETQLRATWEGHRRTRDGMASAALSDFIEETVIDDTKRSAQDLAESATEKLRMVLTGAASLHVFDVHLEEHHPDVTPVASWSRTQLAPMSIPIDRLRPLLQEKAHNRFTSNQSGLEEYLPADTSSHLIIPVHAYDHTYYIFLLTTAERQYTFPDYDINLVRNMGSLLLAKTIQMQVMQADAAKASFLASISHELRTPLHGVMSSQELLRQATKGEAWSELPGLLDLAESSSQSLSGILNDILDFGKDGVSQTQAASGREAKSINLLDTVADEIDIACKQHLDPTRDLTLILRSEDRDWDCVLDEGRIRRVLLNGLTNALKFCRKGKITIALSSHDDSAIIEIHDTGIGFDDSQLSFIFQPFTKIDDFTPGAGLGLHISRSLVASLGGTLTLKSTPNVETIFRMTVPVGLESSASVKTTETILRHPGEIASPSPPLPAILNNVMPDGSRPATPMSVSSDPLRVLVVDDNAICRKLLAMSLKKALQRVVIKEADSGLTALKTYKSWPPHLVLTDISMPEMDGVALASKIREVEREKGDPSASSACRIYAVTALGSSDPRMKALALNGSAAIDGWLIKGKDLSKAIYEIVDEMTQVRKEAGAIM